MGMIPPDVFIGIAERQGLIAQIGLASVQKGVTVLLKRMNI